MPIILLKKEGHFLKYQEKNILKALWLKRRIQNIIPGKRTSDWLKIKHHKTQEAIVAGYTQPSGARKYFGALILGIKEGKKLKYIGHTGGGFNQTSLKEMYEKLQPLVQSTSPFAEKFKTNSPVTWVKPHLICEVKFAEVTSDGKLRQPIFLHLREDKNINEVTMANTKTISKAKRKSGIRLKGIPAMTMMFSLLENQK